MMLVASKDRMCITARFVVEERKCINGKNRRSCAYGL